MLGHSLQSATVKLLVAPVGFAQRRTIQIKAKGTRNKFVSLTVPETADETHLKSILDNNKKWVADSKKQDPDFFVKLSQPQTPKYLYFGCADSRVPANEILGLG